MNKLFPIVLILLICSQPVRLQDVAPVISTMQRAQVRKLINVRHDEIKGVTRLSLLLKRPERPSENMIGFHAMVSVEKGLAYLGFSAYQVSRLVRGRSSRWGNLVAEPPMLGGSEFFWLIDGVRESLPGDGADSDFFVTMPMAVRFEDEYALWLRESKPSPVNGRIQSTVTAEISLSFLTRLAQAKAVKFEVGGVVFELPGNELQVYAAAFREAIGERLGKVGDGDDAQPVPERPVLKRKRP